jgi:tetraacyldisaccharide 4'-kinase
MSPPGRPKGEFRRAKPEGTPVSPPGAPRDAPPELRAHGPSAAPADVPATLTERATAALLRSWYRPAPDALAWSLAPLSRLYGALLAARRLAYRRGWRQSHVAPVPVVVVGNLVAGGAGKTPTVIALVQALCAAGRRPGVVSRGFGRRGDSTLAVAADSAASEVGDEPLLIQRRTGVPVWVGRRRIDAARGLCAAHPEVDVLVADDGLQHLALARQAEVIVFDERGAGNGRLLPSGPLREPLPAAVPPLACVLYNAPAPTTALPGTLVRRRLAGVLPLAAWQAGAAFDHDALHALHALQGPHRRPVLAAAGLAAPERFFAMLEAEGLAIRRLPLADHHRFDPPPWPAGTPEVVVTEKDAVKLDAGRCDATKVWVARLDFELPAGFVQAILQRLDHRDRP